MHQGLIKRTGRPWKRVKKDQFMSEEDQAISEEDQTASEEEN